jgi:hypothetical protein
VHDRVGDEFVAVAEWAGDLGCPVEVAVFVAALSGVYGEGVTSRLVVWDHSQLTVAR